MDKYSIDRENEPFVSLEDEYEKLNYIRDKSQKQVKISQQLFAMELKNGLGEQMKKSLQNPKEHQLKVVTPMSFKVKKVANKINSFFDKILSIFY